MHEYNEFSRYGQTLLWISEHILHRVFLSLPSSSSDYARRDREETISSSWVYYRQLIMFISIYYAPLHLALVDLI
ncbi:hypothetical protein AHAS_Ahas09G0171600 [Arachis hypogaea]